ncbi:MAG TPA: glutamine-hydrolyzing carbamoyl-phosphate synthase small subunit [Flavobacteriaceae bacterium]|nr:glutamine-hydrolyzing carbamoyl-phosphate synthase small subunit [Flavobacteriaceae bacterium]MCB9212943.1 glutamine-hydrolyzing carbamoyl-phosphate synthase small subunit [Alteromonas sp.]HPF11385.1 glutamine-hydrolyzing carbamoyl-phosphate synthase small subunit [Flavobacteriaceae bacterium]HQU20548.1 glutamine-hydrolyzing carbamoyl-phosphate synthase small subunit [Flavobacteriaceae bacterium]HQU65819.1 glutamine-hydrolyzing carbamoyl-phosphate synthase small subunit [Flavobacteriaceae ba
MKYQTRKKALILLADGTIFYGKAVGEREGSAFGEVCFNTGMTGYQEIFTDPSYFGQLMVTTNAHIGNYGTNREEVESEAIKIAGLICRNFSYQYSRVAADAPLEDFLNAHNLLAISDVDTRALVSYIRDHGAMNAVISTEVDNIEGLKAQLAKIPDMNGLELASKVSTKEPYYWGNENAKYRISALDLGIKKNILRNLAARDCYVKVYPYNASFEELQSFEPHGYFISNGPGDPEPLKEAIQTTQKILETNMPVFGICLGHQVLALANGISTYKMHHGHRGINHPIKNLLTGKGEITSQNHGFAINREEAESHPNVEVTHMHLNDYTVAGIQLKDRPAFSVQYHPEASPGPHDASYLFDQFIQNIEKYLLQEAL